MCIFQISDLCDCMLYISVGRTWEIMLCMSLFQDQNMRRIFTSLLEWQLILMCLTHDMKSREVSEPYSLLTPSPSLPHCSILPSSAGLSLIGQHAAQFKEYLANDYEVCTLY